jgi:hypothetical protein
MLVSHTSFRIFKQCPPKEFCKSSQVFIGSQVLFKKLLRAKKSTEQNPLQIVNYITDAVNGGMFCMGVFLDLCKAFNVCA